VVLAVPAAAGVQLPPASAAIPREASRVDDIPDSDDERRDAAQRLERKQALAGSTASAVGGTGANGSAAVRGNSPSVGAAAVPLVAAGDPLALAGSGVVGHRRTGSDATSVHDRVVPVDSEAL
jgi:hypothetical protein